MSYIDELPRPFTVLAPMDDVTDTVFRRQVAWMAAPDLYFTEFVNVDGLQSAGRPKLLRKLRFQPDETRLIAQIWGLKPENFERTAAEIADGTVARQLGLPDGANFVGVDLNMGCPAKSEVNSGACSALIKNRPLAHEIIEATRQGLAERLPLSVKTRVGFSEVDMTWIGYLLEHDLAMLTVHGRTRKQMSKVPADWELIGQARQLRDEISPTTLIVGNGDVADREQALLLAARHGLDGIMIGRGAFQNPLCFADEAAGLWEGRDRDERLAMYRRHVRGFASEWRPGERNLKTLNKFCKVYISGFDGAKELRERLMAASSTDELLELLR